MNNLITALRNADAAGDADAAKRIAAMIRAKQAQQQSAPVENQAIKDLAQDQSVLDSLLIGAGRGLTTIGRAVGLAEPEDPIVTQAFNALEKENPISTTIGEVAGEAAPFLLPGGLVAKAATIPGRMALGGALGATEAGLITKGKGGDGEEIFKNAGLGGAIAGSLELALPIIGRVGGKIFRRITGKTPSSPILNSSGEPSQEFMEALDKAGLTLDDISSGSEQLLDTLNIDDAAAQARKQFLEGQGITPTRAQITGDPNAFQAQSELVGQSGRVTNALKQQEKILEGRFENAVTATGGSTNPSSSPAFDFIADKAIDLDSQINAAYKTAREVAQADKVIKVDNLIKELRSVAGSDAVTGGLASGTRDILKEKGLLGKKGLKLTGRINAETAEEIRISMNGMYDSLSPLGKRKLENLKYGLDDDVANAVGGDVFAEARKAKAKFEKDINRAKVNKFDKRRKNLVREILENKVSPDRFLQETVLNKSVRAIDLEQLKRYLDADASDLGAEAWNQVRADAMTHIKNTAIKEVSGEPALSRAGIERGLESIGDKKLAVLFTPQELKFLDDMLKVSKLREPVRGTQASPSGAAIRNLTTAVNKSSLLQGVFSGAFELVGRDMSGRAALRQPAARVLSPSKFTMATPAILPTITSQNNEEEGNN